MDEPSPQFEIIGPDGVPIGVIRPAPPPLRGIGRHVGLFALTLVTTTIFGALGMAELPEGARSMGFWQLVFHPALIRAGLSFSLPLAAILLAHEMGHYLACRAHRLDATLPYFIPAPIGIGTFGAFIRIRAAIASKAELIDVGASGPIAGFLVTIPFLFAGIARSQYVTTLPPNAGEILGEPLAFKLVARLIHPQLAQGGDLMVDPMGFAAWFGLFATALNLIPLAQLDGGHITYALLGRRQRLLVWPLLGALFVLGLKLWIGWWLWIVVALVIGPRHPRIGGEHAPLDNRRRVIAWLCIAIFVLSFTGQPFQLSWTKLWSAISQQFSSHPAAPGTYLA